MQYQYDVIKTEGILNENKLIEITLSKMLYNYFHTE